MALTVVNLVDTFDEWRVKTNTLGTGQGDLTTLSTTAKGSLVAAINELDGEAHITNVVEDTSPQLGADLDLNSQDITGTGGINITGTIVASTTVTAGTTVSAVTLAGDLLGTINTATEGITQSASNNSTLIATTAYVDAKVIFQSSSNGHITITPNGTGDVRLETDRVRLGSAGEDVTLATNGSGTLTIGPNDAGSGMPIIQLENAGRILLNCVSGQPVIIDGDVQATSYTGALNTATTGTTQSASNNSTLIATTAYVDAQVATENTIAEMNDVTITSLANDNILQYNSGTSRWVNAVSAGGVSEDDATALAIALG